ncbi:hypothetical protein LA080_010045 [Diaporthe eres]|nr:hypothetical protein LA080_010045 [Diaporthe eres]
MAPLKDKSGNVRVTHSGRTPKGPAPYQGESASASRRSTRSSVPHKRKAPVESESDSDYFGDVGVEEVSDEEFHFEPEEASIEDDLLDLLFEFDEEELEEDDPEFQVEIDDSEDDDDETTALPFDTIEEPSGYQPSLDNIIRYRGLFKATVEGLKEASSAIIKGCGSAQAMWDRKKTEPYPIHPGWVLKFINWDPDTLTDRALEDVPARTKSILGDPDLNSENWATKFRNLPKISKRAREMYAGEYIDIVDRLWLVRSPDGRYRARQIETKGYKGATAAKKPGSRILGHRRFLRMTLPDVKEFFSRSHLNVPYHYQFGSQAAPSEDGPAYQCRSDFRSMGHISDKTDGSKTAWPWVREIVNQILFNMLPGLDSSRTSLTLTDGAKNLVYALRQELETKFGQLPDLSHVALNRGCCLMEPPRLAQAIASTRETCVKCTKPFVTGRWDRTGNAGLPWQDLWKLFEPGNPLGGVICEGCSYANPPPGMKFCKDCRKYHPLAAFEFENYELCAGCRKSSRRKYRRKSHKHRAEKKLSEPGPILSEPEGSDSDSGSELKRHPFTDEEAQKLGRSASSVRSYMLRKFNYWKSSKPRHNWTDQEVQTMKRMVAEGASHKEIEEAVGETKRNVQAKLVQLRKSGMIPRPPVNSAAYNWTDENKEKAIRMHGEGKTYEQIAEVLGITPRQVGSKIRGLRRLKQFRKPKATS